MSLRKMFALLLCLALILGVTAAPAAAAEAEILWLPDGVVIPFTLAGFYVPEFNWLSAYRDAEGNEPCVYDLTAGTFVEEYDSIHPFANGLATVYKDGKAGCIDEEKNLCVPFVWDSVWVFHDGVAVACLLNEWTDGDEVYADPTYFLIDTQGHILRQLDWETANADPGASSSASLELYSVRSRNGWVFVDDNGQAVLTLDQDYDTVLDFSSGLAPVWKDGKAGFIDRTGEEVVPCRYDYASAVYGNDGQTARYSYLLDGERMGLVENPDWTGKNDAVKAAQQAAAAPAAEATAYPSTQTVEVDGVGVEFQMYALKDENGNDTNYIKLRDLAAALDLFDVDWADGTIVIQSYTPYTPNGSEGHTPYSGVQTCSPRYAKVLMDGWDMFLDALLITDASGGGHTYFQLRHLGDALGFNVDWTAERGIFIETDQYPHTWQ